MKKVTVKLTRQDGSELIWDLDWTGAIDMFWDSLKENEPDWLTIETTITETRN